MNSNHLKTIILAVFACAVIAGQAATVTLSASADTWILAEFADNNMGAAPNFAAGVNSSGSPMRALLKFDVSQIPANATVTSVTLTLTAQKNNFAAPDATFDLRRLLVDWGEGTGTGNTGSPANPGEATWNDRMNSVASWSSPGGAASTDFSSTTSASALVSATGSYTWGSTAAMVSDVQTWVTTPAANFGWIFMGDDESLGTSARRWTSREGGAGGPSLVVTYAVPVVAQHPAISKLAVTNHQFQFTFNAEANRTYAVEASSSLLSGSWLQVTNYSAAAVATNFVFTSALTTSNKFYRVRTP